MHLDGSSLDGVVPSSNQTLALFGCARKLARTFSEKKSRMHEALNEVYL